MGIKCAAWNAAKTFLAALFAKSNARLSGFIEHKLDCLRELLPHVHVMMSALDSFEWARDEPQAISHRLKSYISPHSERKSP